MFKCLNCNSSFEEPRKDSYHESGDCFPQSGIVHTDYFCPECGDDLFEEAQQCRYCGQWFHSDDDYREGACEECAKEQLTLYSGISYIESDDDLQREFYVEYFMGSDCRRASPDLIDLCRLQWKSYAAYSPNNPLGKLQDFIFEDISAWMEWLDSYEKGMLKC